MRVILLKFSGNSYNQPLYEGLLTNLKLSCRNQYEYPITSCLTIKVQGKRNCKCGILCVIDFNGDCFCENVVIWDQPND